MCLSFFSARQVSLETPIQVLKKITYGDSINSIQNNVHLILINQYKIRNYLLTRVHNTAIKTLVYNLKRLKSDLVIGVLRNFDVLTKNKCLHRSISYSKYYTENNSPTLLPTWLYKLLENI